MTPREKALEIHDYFLGQVREPEWYDQTRSEYAKECGLFLISQLIESDENEHPSDIKIEFWEDVKQEI
jgi:hypothetical protein